MNVQLSITGLKEIDDVFRGFPGVYNHRILQAAHAEAAKPLIYKEHLLAPVGKTGKLADSIGVIKMPFTKAASIGEVQVGPRRGRFGGSAAHLIEFGTKMRNFNGANRGRVTAKPFIEQAFDATYQQVIDGISLALAQKGYAFMKRIIKNG